MKTVLRFICALIASLVLSSLAVSAESTRPLKTVPFERQRPVIAPPPVGPPPTGIGWDASGTYGIFAKVIWAPAPNAVSYIVHRRLMEDAGCCNTNSGPINATSWVDAGLVKKGRYVFTIQVNYANGSVGTADVIVTSEGARNPKATATDMGPGRVRLSWDPTVPGTQGVMVTGPGIDGGSKMLIGGGPYDLPLLTPGNYTWQLASIYTQNIGVVSPPSEWSTVSHTVQYGVGRFRISLERFQAISVTAEDIFRSDGRGDEVFITTQVSQFGRVGRLVQSRMMRTPTFGDVQNFPARVKAGSASPAGGIMPNDSYPAPTEYVSELRPPTANNLPFLLWEGELSEVEGLVMLSPAIWESDEDDQLFPSFAAFHANAASGVASRPQFQGYDPWWTKGARLDSWNPVRSCPAPLSAQSPRTMFVPTLPGWRDEPMDMNVDHSYCPTYVAINWRLADAFTRENPAMILEIPFKSPFQTWAYKLFVRIERAR